MMIIPISGKISWRNPPYITIALIVINTLIYFMFQLHDNREIMRAKAFYFSSGLSEIELPRYLDYLESRSDDPEADFTLPDDEETRTIFLFEYSMRMDRDYEFQKMLLEDEIVRKTDPVYSEWKDLRSDYEEQLSRVVTMKHGLIPAHREPSDFFTYMFLHGGIAHLVGNMIFLWIVGSMIELGCGRASYILMYIATGLFAGGAFCLLNLESLSPLVGASGSISGLMGAFTALYGRKKVRMFLTLGFYFNYFKFPAIVLLPLWIGNELAQLLSNQLSPVAYEAHLGGLIAGGVWGGVSLLIPGLVDKDAFEEAPEDKISPLVEKALERVRDLDMEGGRRLLEEALAMEPENIEVLTHLFHAAAQDPEKPVFHRTAQKLLSILSLNPGDHEKAYTIYTEYLRSGVRPRLPSDLYVRLSQVFAGLGHTRAPGKILAMLLKQKPDLPGVPTALMKLASAYKAKKDTARRNMFLKILLSKYPESPEAGLVRRTLNNRS